MLAQIIAGTPAWVPLVLLALLFYGRMQSRTRNIGAPLVLMLPVIMIALSLGGVLSSFGAHPPGLIAWALGCLAAIGINRIRPAPLGVGYDTARARFHVPGSWTPLALMMAIFFAKYVVGATTAMHPDIVATTGFTMVLSAVFGLLSGTFFARFLRIWAVRLAARAAAGSGLGEAEETA